MGIFTWLHIFCKHIHNMWKIDFFHKIGYISEPPPGGKNVHVTQNSPRAPLQDLMNSFGLKI